jgi:Putative restriction endonuclease
VRSPDAAWVQRSRWETLTAEQRRKFPPLAPDFVIELRSETDSLKKLQQRRNAYGTLRERLGGFLPVVCDKTEDGRIPRSWGALGLAD